MRAVIVAVCLTLAVLFSGMASAAGKSTPKAKSAITYSFDVQKVFERFLQDYSDSEWIAEVGVDVELQRAIQSCFVHLFDQSTVSGDRKVVVIAYQRRASAVVEVDEVMDKLFPGESKGYLVLTVANGAFVASFISKKTNYL